MANAVAEAPVSTGNAGTPANQAANPREEATMITVDLRTDVYIDPALNARDESSHTQEEIESLAITIEESNGLLQPIGIHRTPKIRQTEHNFPYELKYGFGRCAALKFLAEQTEDDRWIARVPAMVKEDSDVTRAAAEQLVENLQRKEMGKMEIARKFKSILDNDSTTNLATLHRMTGWPKPTISNYLRMTNLDPQVQDLISTGKLSWSNAREIERLGLAVEEQRELAALGSAEGATPEKFLNDLKKKFPEKFKEEGAEGASTEAAGAASTTTGTQKAEQALRANVVKEKYLPQFEKMANEAKGKDKEKWQLRVDAAKFFLKQPNTSLGTELAPWEAQLEKEAAQKEAAEKESRSKNAYIRKAITVINTELNKVPSAFLEDGKTPNLNREIPTLPSALAKIKESVVSDLATGAKEGLPKGHIKSGDSSFGVPDVEKLVAEISTAYGEYLDKKKRDKSERERREKEKEAKEAAEKAGAPAGAPAETSAPAPAPTAAAAPAAAAATK